VHVLRGSDRAAVHAAMVDADAVVVTAGPSAQRAMTRADRAATYHDVLVETARSVVSGPGRPHLVFCSSLTVYGDASDHLDVIDEDVTLSSHDDPSPVTFQQAERTYLDAAGGRSCVLRCADIYGRAEPPIDVKVKLAHDLLGGSVPFQGSARFYRVHVDDVAAAIVHAIDHRLTGVYNLTHPEVPPTNQELFDALSRTQDLPPLTYRGELAGPGAPVSVARLLATGFTLTCTDPCRIPVG
jgi:nucleoside-diphosphate-sugar epimerase